MSLDFTMHIATIYALCYPRLTKESVSQADSETAHASQMPSLKSGSRSTACANELRRILESVDDSSSISSKILASRDLGPSWMTIHFTCLSQHIPAAETAE